MNLRRLQMLLYVRELGTVTATAEALYLSVPAVSQQLNVLERDVRMTLLERAGRRLVLTPAGERLAAHAEVLLADLAAAEADLDGLRDGGLGRITIAAFASAAKTLLPRVWSELTAGDAGPVELFLAEHEPEAALAALTRREVDIAIVHSYTLLPRDPPTGTEARHVADDPLLLAVSPAAAARLGLDPGAPVDLADLAAVDWVAPATGSSCMEVMRRASGAAGFVPRVRVTAGDFSVLAALAGADAGVALIPRLALIGQPVDLALFGLQQPVSRLIATVTRAGTGHRPGIRAVSSALDRAVASIDGSDPAMAPVPPIQRTASA